MTRRVDILFGVALGVAVGVIGHAWWVMSDRPGVLR